MVGGYQSSNQFADLVYFGYNTVVVLASTTVVGSPASRTYTVSNGALSLQMGSNTYSVTTSNLNHSAI